MMTFILTLGFIIQKFSMRYLIGDMHYRKYFPFYINYCICFIGMVKWRLKVNDHVLGATLFVLTRLIKVNKLWKVPREAARISAVIYIGMVVVIDCCHFIVYRYRRLVYLFEYVR